MKKCIVLFIVMMMCLGSHSSVETLDVAVLEFCPFICDPAKEDGKAGFSIELEKTIFERAGYQINFYIVPYNRSIKRTEVGEYDAVGFCNDKSSDVNICSTETVGPMIQTFYVKKGNPWRYAGIKSMKDITLGVISGYKYTVVSEEFQQYIEQNKVNDTRVEFHYGDDVLHRIFLKILADRIGTTNEAEYVADYLAKKNGYFDQLEKVGTFETIAWGRMCFSPKNPNAQKHVEILDKGIRQMKASGEIGEIMQKYGLEDWNE